MIAHLLASVTAIADGLDAVAAERRQVTTVDPAADALGFAAKRIRAEVARLDEATKTLTVAQFARLHQTTPSTVRLWITRGELAAEQSVRGEWVIARAARRTKKPRAKGGRPRSTMGGTD